MAVKASTGAPEQQDTLVSEIFVCFEDFEGSGAWLRPAVIQMGFKITDLLKSSHHPTLPYEVHSTEKLYFLLEP